MIIWSQDDPINETSIGGFMLEEGVVGYCDYCYVTTRVDDDLAVYHKLAVWEPTGFELARFLLVFYNELGIVGQPLIDYIRNRPLTKSEAMMGLSNLLSRAMEQMNDGYHQSELINAYTDKLG